MLRKLSVALLIAASPALAESAPAEANGAAEGEAPVAYKTKKVCRSIEVVGPERPDPRVVEKEARDGDARSEHGAVGDRHGHRITVDVHDGDVRRLATGIVRLHRRPR